jgi:hypothetical protein
LVSLKANQIYYFSVGLTLEIDLSTAYPTEAPGIELKNTNGISKKEEEEIISKLEGIVG